MHPTSLILFVCAVAIGPPCEAYAADPSARPIVASAVESKATVDGVTLRVKIPSRVRRSAPAMLTASITNTRQSELDFFATEMLDCRVELMNLATQQTHRQTIVGRTLIGDAPRNGSGIVVFLAPGDKETWQVDLRECYDLSPGRYQLRFQLIEPVSAKLEPIKFEYVE